jgi:hypothetical protein
MKFKKGDRVIIREIIFQDGDDTEDSYEDYINAVGAKGIVTSISRYETSYPYNVRINKRILSFAEGEMELCFQPVILPRELFEI